MAHQNNKLKVQADFPKKEYRLYIYMLHGQAGRLHGRQKSHCLRKFCNSTSN